MQQPVHALIHVGEPSFSQLPASQNANKQIHSESKSNSSAGRLFNCRDSSHVQWTMDMHEVVTHFVQIAAVKTVEALTRDLIK